MYNGLSQVYCIKLETISIQRVNENLSKSCVDMKWSLESVTMGLAEYATPNTHQ